MQTPSVEGLLPAQRAAAISAARALARNGHRSWVVGGAVRDLALGLSPKDVDLATDALPDQIEACFERTIPVGKAFGTIVVPLGIEVDGQSARVELEITTLRRDGGYSDGRHPDAVLFGTSLEEDAARRDFTCNALYLDPLSGELLDPCGGLADLAAGRLRAVGEPERRFREDGLRLLRLARFAAALELEIEEATWRGAAVSLDALTGVSRERVLAELRVIAARPHPSRALELLLDLGALERVLPGLETLQSKAEQGLARAEGSSGLPSTRDQLAALGHAPGVELFLAVLLAPAASGREELALQLLESLRPPRGLVAAVRALWETSAALKGLSNEPGLTDSNWRARARLVRAGRSGAYRGALRLLRAGFLTESQARRLDELDSSVSAMGPEELQPDPFLTSADLAAAGIPRGPRWGVLLREAEDRRLGGADRAREDALAWLRAQAQAT